MRVLVIKTTRIEVEPKRYAELDAHHEYYLDDKQARALITKGVARELDSRGKPVRRSTEQPLAPESSKPEKSEAPESVEAQGPGGKPGSGRATKAVKPPANKTAAEKTE